MLDLPCYHGLCRYIKYFLNFLFKENVPAVSKKLVNFPFHLFIRGNVNFIVLHILATSLNERKKEPQKHDCNACFHIKRSKTKDPLACHEEIVGREHCHKIP